MCLGGVKLCWIVIKYEKSECVYTCAWKILVAVSSRRLSLSVLSLSQKSEFPCIVPECVHMSICEAAISNFARSFSFGHGLTDRFDTMMPGVPGYTSYTQILLPSSLPPDHSCVQMHTSRERGNPPHCSLSRSHTYTNQRER